MGLGLHPEQQTARACQAFVEARGSAASVRRAAEITALPLVAWKGRDLRTLRCHATFGNGPHDVNVPEALLWAVIDLRAWRCPHHAGGFA